jgi:hypothetical protein
VAKTKARNAATKRKRQSSIGKELTQKKFDRGGI